MKKIREELDRDARRFNVSRSFVQATIMAHHYNINEQEDYKVVSRRKK